MTHLLWLITFCIFFFFFFFFFVFAGGASNVPQQAAGRTSSRSSFVSVTDVSEDEDLDLENI